MVVHAHLDYRPNAPIRIAVGYLVRVSLVQTVLVFVVIPAGIYGVVALLTLRVRVSKTPRYRPGQDWDFPPVWWTANPAGAVPLAQGAGVNSAAHARTAWGGARGSW